MAQVGRLQDGDNIPNSDHVVRYCSPRNVQDGKILSSAFTKKKGEDYLSVNWLEYFNGNMDSFQRLQSVRDCIRLNIRPNGRFVKISVGDAKKSIKHVQVKYKPANSDPTHAGIYLSLEENLEQTIELGNFLLFLDSTEIFPAVVD